MPLNNSVIEGQVDIHIVERSSLRGHEEVIPSNLETRISKLQNKGFYKPIIVDSETLVILDGHHKWTAAGVLDLNWVPVVKVNYLSDPSVTVDVWPGCGKELINKEEVIEMGLSEDVFPPKTSRHIFEFEVPQIQVPLKSLRA